MVGFVEVTLVAPLAVLAQLGMVAVQVIVAVAAAEEIKKYRVH